MENLYIFGGYILTAGKLDNGEGWEGVNVMLAPIRKHGDSPVISYVYKASRKNRFVTDMLSELVPGAEVIATFGAPDFKGRVKLASLEFPDD